MSAESFHRTRQEYSRDFVDGVFFQQDPVSVTFPNTPPVISTPDNAQGINAAAQPLADVLSDPVYADALQANPKLLSHLEIIAGRGYRFITEPGKKVDGVYPGQRLVVMTSGVNAQGETMHPSDIAFALKQAFRNVDKIHDLYYRVTATPSPNIDNLPLLGMRPGSGQANQHKPAPYLTDPAQREAFRVEIRNGKLVRPDGTALNTADFRTQVAGNSGIFVVMPNGDMYVASGLHFIPEAGLLRDSSLSLGQDVLYSGVVGTTPDGEITMLSDYSESYEPNLQATENFLVWLKGMGVAINEIRLVGIYGLP